MDDFTSRLYMAQVHTQIKQNHTVDHDQNQPTEEGWNRTAFDYSCPTVGAAVGRRRIISHLDHSVASWLISLTPILSP